jgi:hypothetical protein
MDQNHNFYNKKPIKLLLKLRSFAKFFAYILDPKSSISYDSKNLKTADIRLDSLFRSWSLLSGGLGI